MGAVDDCHGHVCYGMIQCDAVGKSGGPTTGPTHSNGLLGLRVSRAHGTTPGQHVRSPGVRMPVTPDAVRYTHVHIHHHTSIPTRAPHLRPFAARAAGIPACPPPCPPHAPRQQPS